MREARARRAFSCPRANRDATLHGECGRDPAPHGRRRRHGPGWLPGRGFLARGGFRRPGDPRRRRAGPALPAPAALQGLSHWRDKRGSRLDAAGQVLHRAPAGAAAKRARDRDRPRREAGRPRLRRGASLRPSRAGRGRAEPALARARRGPRWRASTPDPRRRRGTPPEARSRAGGPSSSAPGFIGLEVAAVAAARGIAVTVVEAMDRPMARALSPEMSGFFRVAHERQGIRFVFGATVVRVLGTDGRATGVETADGRRFAADLILVGIGVIPNAELRRGRRTCRC